MAVKIFDALESTITRLGDKSGTDTRLSELLLIVTDGEKVVSFSLLGLDLILTPAGEVGIVEDADGEVSGLDDELKKSVFTFLAWRVKFADQFGL